GIAHVFALAGYDVHLSDIKPEAIKAALATVERNLNRQAARGRISHDDVPKVLARIHPAESLDVFKDADLVIESATENEQVKKAIFQSLLPKIGPKTILATNTSSISITRLASTTDRPERFMGVHFMNPVPVMQLVELIRGIATDDATFSTMKAIAQTLGKTA